MPSKVPGRAGPEQVPNDLDEAGQNPAQRAAKPRQTASHTNRGPKMVLRLFRAMAALSPQKPTSMDAVPANIHSADYAFEVCAGSCRDGAACRPPGWATTSGPYVAARIAGTVRADANGVAGVSRHR